MAFFAVACTKAPPISEPPPQSLPAAESASIQASQVAEASAALPSHEPFPEVAPIDVLALERRFLASGQHPEARIEVVQQLADATPAAALAMMNRVFPLERREDVKMEMLAALGALDHDRDRDNQLALCQQAVAATQPTRVRYVAVQVLADLSDPRALTLLQTLQADRDSEIRAAAAQVLRDRQILSGAVRRTP